MSAKIILILMILNIEAKAKTSDTETYICYGREKSYNCVKYNGRDSNVYEYTRNSSKSSGRVYEFSDAGTRNPYAPSDDEPTRLDEPATPTKDIPVFIPYNPAYLFPSYEIKK